MQRAWATLQLQHMASHCGDFSCCQAQLLGCSSFSCCSLWAVVVAPGLLSTASVVVAHRFSCFRACGIFPEQGSNWHLLHWQDSLPLNLQASLINLFLKEIFSKFRILGWRFLTHLPCPCSSSAIRMSFHYLHTHILFWWVSDVILMLASLYVNIFSPLCLILRFSFHNWF